MASRRLGAILYLILFGLGLAVTAFWTSLPEDMLPFARSSPGPLLLSLGLLAALTTINLGLRWVRWRYLLRRVGLNLRARDSLMVWTVTLPAIATPFYLGELLRGVLLARRYPGSARTISGVWIVERITDALVLGGLVLAAQDRWSFLITAAALAGAAAGALHLRTRSKAIKAVTRPSVLGVATGSALVAWALPTIGLWFALDLLGAPATPAGVVNAFGIGTLVGGLTGIPLGVGVTGSAMILVLQDQGVGLAAAALVAAVFRAGTAWFALGLGVVALIRRREQVRRLLGLSEHADHFDLISLRYEENIPQHLTQRLLQRKIQAMQTLLEEAGATPDWTGLDVGCGHGWYACAMAESGFRMDACDLSIGQARQAFRNFGRGGESIPLSVADADSLPYADSSLDFAYAVNVIHHLPSANSVARVMSEIVRILKPGGLFFLHEINTQNPLFRFYMGYVFPLFKDIDEGTESWIPSDALPVVEGASWQDGIQYFSFLPDFAPSFALPLLSRFEVALERSFLNPWSSHYIACLRKHDGSDRVRRIQDLEQPTHYSQDEVHLPAYRPEVTMQAAGRRS